MLYPGNSYLMERLSTVDLHNKIVCFEKKFQYEKDLI
jgi:hypothetical protein